MAREDVEALRRRLYAPGASPIDVERYRGVEVVKRLAVIGPDGPPPLPGRRGPRLLVPLVVAAVVLCGLAVARAEARSATPVLVPVVRPPTAVALPAADRDSVREALESHDDVAVAAFLIAHRAPPALRSATRSLLVEQTGVGAATVGVDPGSSSVFRGRATVLLVLERSGEAGWTTFWRRADASGARTLERQQQRRGFQAAGDLTTATTRYGSGEQPVEVRIDAPTGVRWAVEVVFTD